MRWIVAGLCLGALCCAGGKDRTTDRKPRAGLSEERLLLHAAILRAEDRRVVDDALRNGAAHPDAKVRALAARALGRIADPAELQTILGLAEDGDSTVRAEGVYALGLLGDAETLPLLEIAARDPESEVRVRAADALGMLHAPGSREILVEMMGDTDRRVAAAACFATTRFSRADFAVEPLLRLIQERYREAGLAAVHALAWHSSRPLVLGPRPKLQARETLIEMATSPDAEIRRLVALGLTAPASEAEGEVISSLAYDPVAEVRIQAVEALGYPGAPVEPFMPNALSDRDQRVALAAIQAMGRMEGAQVLDFLAYVVVNDHRIWLRREAVIAMARVERTRAAAMANGISKAEEPELRAAAATLLYDQPPGAAQTIAERLLLDSDPLVRLAAIPAMAPSASPLTKTLRDFLDETDPGVLSALADAAERRLSGATREPEDRADTLSLLESAWTKAAANPAAGRAQIALLDAAAAAGKDERGHALLTAGLESAERQVRLRAIQHLRAVYEEDHSARAGAAAERPVEEYLDILRWGQTPRAALVTVRRPGFIPDAFSLALDTSSTPLTAWNFARLAQDGFYDGLEIHRVVPNFVVQDGDPLGDGTGDPGYMIRDEVVPSTFGPGTLGMASAGKDTAGSQWFLTLTPQPRLGGRYTPFGHVVKHFPGVAAQLLPGDRIESVKIYAGDGSEEIPPPEEL